MKAIFAMRPGITRGFARCARWARRRRDHGDPWHKPAAPAAAPALPVSIDDVRAAHARIAGAIVRTPTLHSRTLSELTGARSG